MSIEQQLTELNTNIKALVAAIGSIQGGAAAAGTAAAASTTKPAASGKGKTSTAKETPPSVSVDEMQGALGKVKEKYDAATAKAIIKSVGGVEKMNEIPTDKVQAVYDAATKKLAEEEQTSTDDGDGL